MENFESKIQTLLPGATERELYGLTKRINDIKKRGALKPEKDFEETLFFLFIRFMWFFFGMEAGIIIMSILLR